MRQPVRGFTLVELFILLLALGALAAWAMPRLGPEQREARVAKLGTAHGAVQSAAALIHGTARSRHNLPQPLCGGPGFGSNPPLVNTAGNGNVCTENGRLQVASLYPAASLAGVVAAAGLVPVAGTPREDQLVFDGFRAVPVAGGLQLQVLGGPEPAQCSFTYSPPAALGQAPAITATVVSGC